MTTIANVLSEDTESIPAWLESAENRLGPQMIAHFFSSRIVYYPGAENDGRAFAVFGSAHSAHCFLHIDYSSSAQQILGLLMEAETGIRGYTPTSEILSPERLCELLGPFNQQPPSPIQSVLWTILQRNPDLSHDHGPERLAFLHIQAEAVWLCSEVWGRHDQKPFGIILQDHSFGGINRRPTGFGGEGHLYQVAQCTALAKYLLVARNTTQWPHQYEAASEMTMRCNGQQNTLFRKIVSLQEPSSDAH